MQTFLKPLSPKEEAHWLSLLHHGDKEQRKMAKDVLTERNLRLVAHIARKYQNAGEDPEDMISTGIIGLLKALESFALDKGKLSTYAARCIENEMLMLLRTKKKTAKDISLYEPIGTDREGNEISLLDITMADTIDSVEKMTCDEQIERLPMLIDTCLTDTEKMIISKRYGLSGAGEVTQKMIGKELGISRSYVSRIEKKALLKLRAAFISTEIS